jgi:hypothetical protein
MDGADAIIQTKMREMIIKRAPQVIALMDSDGNKLDVLIEPLSQSLCSISLAVDMYQSR